jgi:MinD-like ATPase involved in chromosome partitioning or flagellar assembly
MAVRYDEALPKLLQLCEEQDGFGNVEVACAVRDLRGRLRLVCQPARDQAAPDWVALTEKLQQELGGWFAAPILQTASRRREEERAAEALLKQSEPWPSDWPQYLPNPLGGASPLPARWRALPRTLTKEAWLRSDPAEPPWPLLPGRTPVIVSFYSFKGGVGRTTALAMTARQWALQGKRVLLIDMDLEAPGLGPLFDIQPAIGVIDALLQHAATGSLDIAGLVHEVEVRGATLDVVSAGRLGWSHLEKLARLDYLHTAGSAQSPVEAGLRELLKRLRAVGRYDVLLLDARAGLHDLAGLALHGLSHVDVLVGRANEQSRAGLELTLQALAKRRPAERRIVLVQTFVPGNGRDAAVSAWRTVLHRLLSEHIYGDAPFALTDALAPHAAIAVDDLGALGAPFSLSDAHEVLLGLDVWRELAGRIWEQVT